MGSRDENFKVKKYIIVRDIIATLDIVLAILIIISTRYIIDTPLAAATLIFGYGMLTVTTVLKILQKW
ncbi:MAG: hypothetical protein AABW75_02890 [Nanoarchaeota archaeon]